MSEIPLILLLCVIFFTLIAIALMWVVTEYTIKYILAKLNGSMTKVNKHE